MGKANGLHAIKTHSFSMKQNRLLNRYLKIIIDSIINKSQWLLGGCTGDAVFCVSYLQQLFLLGQSLTLIMTCF